jgi:hypothetical protein
VASATFNACTAVATIPAGLFANESQITNLSGLFGNCSGITAIPSGLFDSLPILFDATTIFQNCSNVALTTIPAELFNNCPAVAIYTNTIEGTRLTAAAIDELLINIEATNTSASPSRTIDYSPVTGNGHLDANRSAPALQAINDMISDGWTRNGTYE